MKTISLSTLRDATKQEVFEFVATHLLKQGQKSFDGGTYCMYRGDNGLKCAIGCLMTDQEYQPTFEHQSWESLALKGLVPIEHHLLLIGMQVIHDEFPVARWREKLKWFGIWNNLNVDFLTDY